MASDIKPTRNIWVSLDDLTATYLSDLLENLVEDHAKNVEAIDRVLTLIDDPSEERTRLIKMSNDEYEKLKVYREVLKQLHLADTSTYIITPEASV